MTDTFMTKGEKPHPLEVLWWLRGEKRRGVLDDDTCKILLGVCYTDRKHGRPVISGEEWNPIGAYTAIRHLIDEHKEKAVALYGKLPTEAAKGAFDEMAQFFSWEEGIRHLMKLWEETDDDD